RCDELNFDGTTKPHTQKRDSYNHAQKMRAAMTYAFGRLCGLGSLPWHESEVTGRMMGNPSVSETVATYMTSLRRRKVRAGETATSARAITQETLYKLYHYNHKPEVAEIKEYAAGSRKKPKPPNDWGGGGRARRFLGLAYALSFLCLLRFDEVLKIQMHDIEWISDTCIQLTLPFRKTNQFGGVKPFYLYLLPPHLAHLCPIRALAEWLTVSEITDGYLFRKIASGDRVSTQNSPMTSDFFLEMFRNNLLDVKIDPYPYGTHSFRRGGCQWLYTCCRWGLIRICDWGGWSTEFSSLTIVKYLISYVDDPSERREDYMNPNRAPSLKCFSCGRTCHCV
ncbi:DNA breaking-rejoining enzyme, partial [Mycena olivaceomarginata]